jgi:DHA1 family tetracycline resistance protein-like MFS transporter
MSLSALAIIKCNRGGGFMAKPTPYLMTSPGEAHVDQYPDAVVGGADDGGRAKPGVAAFGFILVSVFLDALAGGLIFPVTPQLIRSVSTLDAAGVARAYGALMTVFFLLQLFASPIQGALSDRFGRRPVILASSLGLALDYGIMAVAPNLSVLFVGRAISGVMSAGASAAFAYVSDVSTDAQRARRFGLFGAAMAAGATLGPVLGGYLGQMDARAPFWAAGAFGLAGTIYGLLVLGESLPKTSRSPLKLGNLHPLGVATGLWREFPALRSWGFAYLLLTFGFSGVNSILAVYTTYRFGWGPKEVGLYMTAIALEAILVQALAVGPVVRWLGERRAFAVGLALQILGTVAAGLSATGLQFWLAVSLVMIGGVSGPAQSSIINALVGPADRGRLTGATRSLASLAAVGSPALFSSAYAATLGAPHTLLAGLPFYIAALFMALSVVACARALRGGEAGVLSTAKS